jgi:transcription-repair coupling factor (superfamily II helicase)
MKTDLPETFNHALVGLDDIVHQALPLGRRVDVTGAQEGAAAVLLARCWQESHRPLVVLTVDETRARRLAADLRYCCLEANGTAAPEVVLYPAHDLPAYSALRPDRRNTLARVAALTRAASGSRNLALVVPAQAWTRRVVGRTVFRQHLLPLELAQEIDRDELLNHLVTVGYRPAPLVEEPGTYAVRGALVDLYPPSAAAPYRIELDGDLVCRIRAFDPETQRTAEEKDDILVEPAAEVFRSRETLSHAVSQLQQACDEVDWPTVRTRELLEGIEQGSSLVSAEAWLPAFYPTLDPLAAYLPEGALYFIEETSQVMAAWAQQWDVAEQARDQALEQGEPSLPPEAHLIAGEEARDHVDKASRIFSYSVAVAGDAPWDAQEAMNLGAQDNRALKNALAGQMEAQAGEQDIFAPLTARLAHLTEEQGVAVRLVAHSAGQAERLLTLLGSDRHDVAVIADAYATPAKPAHVQIVVGELTQGCYLPSEGLAWIAEEEVFGRQARRRRRRRGTGLEAFDDLSALEAGQLVVHVDHGIGRYQGLVRRTVDQLELEFLLIEYLGGDRLYLPVHRLNQIQRYIGGDTIKLDRLGGQTFTRRKKKARRHVEELADQLLQVQATRQALPGASCGPPDPMFVQLEATFPYEETDEQQQAIDDVVGDLESERVMDRLVCGDVGFGKTEVAIRAAFRMVLAGRQVAVLVPTTVLAQQHYHTFQRRLGGFPVTVAVLSRFRTAAEQTKVLRDLKSGAVDIVVGTHRLLSKDVHFKELGLLIIDEEHRFGVEHKERIKKLRTQIDLLTLSATPIPRTLQMALSNLRDLSLITTPPAGRRAVRTYVCQLEDKVLRDSIQRELARGGQVYFVRNRIQGLRERAEQLTTLLPEARIRMAHGQMPEGKLEGIMLDFVEGRIDVLLCTTIVESGLDVPRANTVIIERADQLGLAQLYHIRGRVGRAQERAYAYLLVPPAGRMTDDGKRRVAALQQLTELGSGFALSMMDLEIRGAGELLGAEQSGQVAAVGYQMYVELLDDAIHEMRGEPPKNRIDPELSFDVPGFIPEEHVPDTGQRLWLYKRLAGAEDAFEVHEIAAESRDRFGPAPAPLENLFRMMEVKAAVRHLGALGIEGTRRAVTIHLSDRTPLTPEQILQLVTQPNSPYRVTPDMKLRCRLDERSYSDSIEGAASVVQKLWQLLPENKE